MDALQGRWCLCRGRMRARFTVPHSGASRGLRIDARSELLRNLVFRRLVGL
jgi:hypothetical protein